MLSEGKKREGTLDLMAKKRRWKQQIVSVNQHDFRELFGVHSADKWGSFVDCNLSAIVHSYADWAGYPRGKHTKLEGRQTEELTVVVISSDGYHLFAAMLDGRIAVLDLHENCEIGAWKAHEGPVRCLDYHGSGLLASVDKSIRIWDGHIVALIRNLEGHTDWINSVAFSEDGNRVVSGSHDNSIRLWSIETGECLRQFLGHCHSVFRVRLIGEMIVSIADDSYLKVWDPSESEATMSIGGPGESIDGIFVNCDHSLVILNQYFEPIVYSWPKMNEIRRIDGEICLCCFHPCKPHLVAMDHFAEKDDADNPHLIRIHDVRKGGCILEFKDKLPFFQDMSFTPDGTRLVCVESVRAFHILDVSSLLSL